MLAAPAHATAPIVEKTVEVEIPLTTPQDIEEYAREEAKREGISAYLFVETLRIESMNFTWNDQSLIPAHGPNGREDSWGICQIHLPDHPEITKAQALDPRWCIQWTAQQFKNHHASMWTGYRIVTSR